ncbi:BTAD domain-containing putative transcriptional regulator [Streptomyces sp. ACA25]|uniref:AfsR/SARP family transcriptional regulator n=1 Tax=Streptomyces sp. ACA25 TaxID=3022596 RepID=UPI00230722FA|nr:AfsR/SARP family transcriptional regulator [Streptomyces sp. ACA25]MDB1087126.1 BTAD domain-containing putative transcriptional regulator [Streptomyces sp. ACA25]
MAVGEGSSERGESPRTSALRFTVLGPVRAWCDGELLPGGSPQQRALLAELLLRNGRTVTAQELVDALWGEEPPQQAVPTLRTYAFRLRKALGPRAEVLASESGGYALRLGPGDALDLNRLAELTAGAEQSAAAGEFSRAHELYSAALELWDGEALAGVPGPAAEQHRTRLAEERLHLREQRLEVGLKIGLHAESVSELTSLTTTHPLRERLPELLMLALYRSGRQAEALAVYMDTRQRLDEELGVEPRAELSGLHQRILNADESLAVTGEQAAGTAPAPRIRPAQLPAAVSDFTGRKAFVAELSGQLAQAGGSVMAVSAVAGIGGVGKTTLAVQVAHAAREHFPDGQLYVDLQGAGADPAEPTAVLGTFLRALGTPDSAIPESLTERSGLYRSLLDGRRLLALLDNARDAAQIRPLLPGNPGCAALVTSRTRMVDLAGAHLVDLDVMSPEEALTLFTRIVGAERVNSERKAAMDVVAACGFLPLAIRIAAARLAARRTWTVSVLARKLSDERRRLDELQAGDQAVKATFELGYGQLEAGQARAFRLLGLAEGPDISLHAAAALLDRDPETAEDILESLVDTSLLESAAPGRYRLHDLVRLFARACAERDEQPPEECDAALSRLLDFYLATTAGVYARERPGDRTLAHLARTRRTGLDPAGREAALDWLYSEAECLLACVRQTARGDTLPLAADILIAGKDLAESGAFSRQYEQTALVVLAAAQQAGDARAEGRARVMLTHGHSVSGRFVEADEEARQAMLLGAVTEDPIACGYAPNDRAIIALYQKRYSEAEAYLERAIAVFRADGNQPAEASSLCNLSRVHLSTGRTASAVELALQAHASYERMGITLRLANAKYALGLALTEAGRHTAALQRLGEALAIFRENRQRLWEGMTLFRLAEAHLAMGRAPEAAVLAEQALGQLRDIGGAWRRANVLTVLGHALNRTSQQVRAQACWQQALTTFEELGSPEAAELRALLESASV